MATKISEIINNLCAAYDFRDKTIISVGAGGGQFIEYARSAKKVIAVDQDPNAVSTLRKRVEEVGLVDTFEIITSDFHQISPAVDAVLFEFSLHEMPSPTSAIEHALSLAPAIVVIDHAKDSDWSYYVAEEEKVRISTRAIQNTSSFSQKTYQSEQYFENYAELFDKVKPQGTVAIERIEKYKGVSPIRIEAAYSIYTITT